MWLYVYSDESEYSYVVDEDVKKIFLKEVSLYYDGCVQDNNTFRVSKMKDGSILYKSGTYRHKQLKPSYWQQTLFFCALFSLLYLMLTQL